MSLKCITTVQKCVGCSACSSICPNRSISMDLDEFGFFIPIIDSSKCIECKKCISVCPVESVMPHKPDRPKAYGMFNNNLEQRVNSSSGGIFILLAQYIISKGGYVFGAVLSKDCRSVECVGSNDINFVTKMMGSKYVQSQIENAFLQVKELLEKDLLVLFTGTPCQIGALKNFLQKDYKTLYTQDVICHGVPSPGLWENYIDCLEQREKSPIQLVSFRNKSNGWKSYSIEYSYSNGLKRRINNNDDLFMRGMLQHLSLRSCCYNCNFKGSFTLSDITLADLWNIDDIAPEKNDDLGCSLVLIQTEKGEQLIRSIINKCTTFEIAYDKLNLESSLRYNSAAYNVNREAFMNEVIISSAAAALKRYCGESRLALGKKKIWRLMKKLGLK